MIQNRPWHAEAKRLFSVATPMREIASRLGLHHNTVQRFLTPESGRLELARKYKRRKENPERHRAEKRRWRKANRARNPIKVRLRGIRRHAQKEGYTPCTATVSDVEAQYAAQGGCCAICGRPEADLQRSLHIDHCHKTGEFRGLLCARCNTGLVVFEKYPDAVHRYLGVWNF